MWCPCKDSVLEMAAICLETLMLPESSPHPFPSDLCVGVCAVANVHEVERRGEGKSKRRRRQRKRYERVGLGCLPPRPKEHKKKDTAIKPLYDYEY